MEGHEYEKQQNYKECGRSMLAAAESLPDHPKHAERLWNAGSASRTRTSSARRSRPASS